MTRPTAAQDLAGLERAIDQARVALMAGFIAEHPEIWNEDIGEEG
jgi:hypothetical protein